MTHDDGERLPDVRIEMTCLQCNPGKLLVAYVNTVLSEPNDHTEEMWVMMEEHIKEEHS